MTFPTRLLALLLALTLAACDSGGTDSGPDDVTATGTLSNTFNRPVDGATLTFAPAAGRGVALPTYTATTTASGGFSLDLPAGTYTLTVTHPNYGTSTSTVTVSGTGTVSVATPPVAGPGALATLLVNALTGDGVPNAAIQCSYRRPDGTYPAPPAFDFSATTTAAGAVAVTGTPFGPMQCTASTPFGSQTFTVTIAATGTTTAPTVPATPLPASGQYRVVLSWGTAPSDLDSHLTGPDGAGGRFHVYFGMETEGGATLDLDDTSGEGPETVTVDVRTGTYRYSVHNFTDQNATGAQGIAGSPTTVRLYGSGGLLKTYVAPAATAGNTWRVFELVVSGTQATITDGAGAGLGYVTAADSDDEGTFLTGGPGGAVLAKAAAL